MELPMQVVVAVVVAVIVLLVIIFFATMVSKEARCALTKLFDIPSFIDCLIKKAQDPNAQCTSTSTEC